MTRQVDRMVLLAASIEQAVAWKGEHRERARFAAGGTDLLLQTRSGKLKPEVFIRLPAVSARVVVDGATLVLPALATLADLAAHPLILKHVPVLAQAMTQIGSPQIRNVATLAGNLCNASPAADSAPVLLVYDASVVLTSVSGRRELPLDQLFLGPGKTALAQDELLLEVRIPLPPDGEAAFFRKFGPRGANVISSASFAARVKLSGTVVERAFLAAGSVGPRPLRLKNTEKSLAGVDVASLAVRPVSASAQGEAPGDKTLPDAVLSALGKDISPITDVRGSGWYKGQVIERCMQWLADRLGGSEQ